ncbi:hypothetical protein NDR87_32655 [Nocardia sp. CDC159]|uniref:CDP-glycerol:poly(Glycerophosphate) glycerophosphotransferase n=1 Tax=Nocardia pulmonis TaxID=2951408 RepID=A0A9X2EF12_9NOCA|nr:MULTISPECIES: hypothetical protein [Nocardia]MCM6778245.1 hypothetical protein [Nocardia pulmonis]MCM6791134.1 hypothetical protein [Nocardia sp. CDC159]
MSPSDQHAPDNAIRWSTYPHNRTVLAITHNTTAATRLFDTLSLLAPDPRIRIDFTRMGSSVFDTDASEFLGSRGTREIPWKQALLGEYDLAVSASYGGKLHKVRAPLIVVPHGMGYNKYLQKNKEQRTKNKEQRTKNKEQRTKNKEHSVFGLSPDWLLHKGRVVPSLIVLSHHEQRERLFRDCPQAVAKSLVAGDICYDRLCASMPLRPSYRRAFGLGPRQRLVLISSTWGPDSLLASEPDLPRRLAAALPADEFRIALAIHPNIRSYHSRWQVEAHLDDAARAGVHLLRGVDDWRAAVVAADLAVSDHGSVGFYSTALGNPLLLAAAPEHTVDPDSPIAQLLRAAPRLDGTADIEAQIRRVLTAHDPHRYAAITALTTSEPAAGAPLLRSAMYRMLRLPEPTEPPDPAVLPIPAAPLRDADAYLVHVRIGSERSATITRYSAERLLTDERIEPDGHLVVGVDGPRGRWLASADVLIGRPGGATAAWIADTLRRLPNCVIAAAPTEAGHWLLGNRTTVVRVRAPDGGGHLFASVAYRLHGRGAPLEAIAGSWRIRCGGTDYRFSAEATRAETTAADSVKHSSS